MKIVYCVDENYLKYAEKSIESVLYHNPKAEIIIVSLKPIKIGKFKNVVIPVKKEFRKRCENDRISKTAYLKCYLTQLPYDKIIYLDCDVMCQKSLKELWDIPCQYINICQTYTKDQAKALGLDKYALSGMMVMNLDNLRKIDFTKRCLDCESIPEPETGWQHDETMINLALKGKLNFIDQKFNYCRNRFYESPIKEQEAHILHYVGNQKDDMLKSCLIIGRSPFVNKVAWDKVDWDRFFVICINYPVPDIPVDVVVAKDEWVNPVLAPDTKFISPIKDYHFTDNPVSDKDIGFRMYSSTSAVYYAHKMGFKTAYLIGIDHKEDNKPYKHYDGIINKTPSSDSSNRIAKEYIQSFNDMLIYQTNPTVRKQWGLPYRSINSIYTAF